MRIKKRYLLEGIIGMLTLLLGVVFSGSCSKGAIYGDLEGNWQIMSVTDNSGEEVEIFPYHYYSFMRNVVQLRVDGHAITGNLVYTEPYLKMDFPYETDEARMKMLREWWITENPIIMRVEKLDEKSLVLQTDDYRIYCRRY